MEIDKRERAEQIKVWLRTDSFFAFSEEKEQSNGG